MTNDHNITNNHILFFELIQVALGRRKYLSKTPTSSEWQSLYDNALKQSLEGICFAGVQKLANTHSSITVNLSKSLRMQWMGIAAMIQQKNEVVDGQCVELQKRLFEAGLRSSILKGQGVGALYTIKDEEFRISNLSGLRMPGDIDVYVFCGRKKAIELAQSIQDEVDWDYKHLHLKVFPDTEVEMHYRPEVLLNLRKNARLQRWFDDPKVQCAMFQVSGELVTPSVEFNLFYVLLHIYRHFLFEGVGLRQLMDYYFVLNKFCLDLQTGALDRKSSEFREMLREFGMMRFARGVMWIMENVFEGNCSISSHPSSFTLGVEPDEKEGQYILTQVMAGGNFGHYDERLKCDVNGKKGAVMKVLRHNMHLLVHYPSDVLWAPIYFLWHFGWKRFRSLIPE